MTNNACRYWIGFGIGWLSALIGVWVWAVIS